jgi:hypothetical protein
MLLDTGCLASDESGRLRSGQATGPETSAQCAFGLIAAVFGAVLCLSTLSLVRNRESSINLDAFQRIEEGMDLEQVEAVLGGCSRDESGRTNFKRNRYESFVRPHIVRQRVDRTHTVVWWGPAIVVDVSLDELGKVVGKKFEYHEYGPRQLGVFERIRSWCGI